MKAFTTLSAGIGLVLGFVACGAQAQQDPRAAQNALGKRSFDVNCAACHGAAPGYPPLPDVPGTMALRAKYGNDKPALLTERTDLTPEFVAHFVRNGISIMPFYRRTEISDAELAAVGAYLSEKNPAVAGKGR